MTPIVTLEEAKAFIRVESQDEDVLIQQLIATASETAMAHADGIEAGGEIPESVRTSALLHIGRLYDTREEGAAPVASVSLANRYRKWDV